MKSYGMKKFCKRCKKPTVKPKTINPRVQCQSCGGTIMIDLPVIWHPTTITKSFLFVPYSKKTVYKDFEFTSEAIERIQEEKLGIEIKEYSL